MGTLRASWRLLVIASITVAIYIFLMLGNLLAVAAPELRARVRNFCFRTWARAVLWVLGARLEVYGDAPTPPFFLVANHLSYIDILVLAARVDAVFIAKSEVSTWPVVGRLCRGGGTLFVDRGLRRDLPRVIADIERVLAGGEGIVLFPEGRSTAGFEVGPFRPSLLEVAARATIPVSYAALGYRTGGDSPPAHLVLSWWGDMKFGKHVWRLLRLRGFTARLLFGTETVRESDRKRLAERLYGLVVRQFVPVVKTGAPGGGS